MRSERVRFLASLSQDQALEIYLSLRETSPRTENDRPSPMVMAMRRALARRDNVKTDI